MLAKSTAVAVQAAWELLCFDLDGTLVDSAPDLSFSLGAALGAVDLPPPTEAQTRGWIDWLFGFRGEGSTVGTDASLGA